MTADLKCRVEQMPHNNDWSGRTVSGLAFLFVCCCIVCPVECFAALTDGIKHPNDCPGGLGSWKNRGGKVCAPYFKSIKGKAKNMVAKSLQAACQAKAQGKCDPTPDASGRGTCHQAGLGCKGCCDDPKAKQEADEMLNLIAESSQDLAKEKAKGFSCW